MGGMFSSVVVGGGREGACMSLQRLFIIIGEAKNFLCSRVQRGKKKGARGEGGEGRARGRGGGGGGGGLEGEGEGRGGTLAVFSVHRFHIFNTSPILKNSR